MAFSTEFVAKADEYQTVTHTLSGKSTSVYIPEGEWMCSLTARVSIGWVSVSWIELDGKRASASTVDEPGQYPTADLGVVVPSFVGGRSISVKADASRTMNFYAAKIGY